MNALCLSKIRTLMTSAAWVAWKILLPSFLLIEISKYFPSLEYRSMRIRTLSFGVHFEFPALITLPVREKMFKEYCRLSECGMN